MKAKKPKHREETKEEKNTREGRQEPTGKKQWEKQ
jgi:hypothetical protein